MCIKEKFTLFSLILLILPVSIRATDITSRLNRLLNAEKQRKQEKILKKILKEEPSPDTLIVLLKSIEFKEPKKRGIVCQENLCIDGVKRPFCWYIPASYEPSQKTPLLVCLHGGVTRLNLIEEPVKEVKESQFIKLADEYGYILLFPFGHAKATWFDSVGVSNVYQQIRITKRKFNIDDNRVYMTGFSDGGSGAFFFAMTYPTDFAGFIPLNGHPGVNRKIQTYFVNLFNRPL